MSWSSPLTRILIILLLCTAVVHNIWSQRQAEVAWDSIAHVLTEMPENALKVDRLIDAGYFRYNHFGDSVLEYGDLAIAIADKTGYIKGKVSAFVMMGSFCNTNNRFEEAIQFNLAAIEANKAEGNILREAQIRDNLANVFVKQGLYDTAMQIKLEALDQFLMAGDSTSLAGSYANIGWLYQQMNAYEKSILPLKKALSFSKTARQVGFNLGNIAIAMKQLGEIDSALYFYKKSIAALPDYPQFLGKTYNNMALLFLGTNNNDSTEHYFQLGKQIYAKNSDTLEMAVLQINWAEADLQQGSIDAALKKCEEVRDLILSHGTIRNQKRLMGILTSIYEKMGAFKMAFQHSRNFHRLDDSINNLDMESRLAEIETKYETTQKEKQILTQQIEIERKSKQRNRLYAGLVGLALLAGMVIYVIAQRAHFQKIKLNDNLEMQALKLRDLERNNRIMTLNATLAGEESERKRIAKDLHDSLGALLASVKLHFRNIDSQIKAVHKMKPFSQATRLLDEAAVEVRRIAHNMMPEALMEFGLIPAIEDMVVQLKQQNYQVQFEQFGSEERLDPEKEMMLYRIIQEMVQNILKHSQANQIIIQYTNEDNLVHLIVEDNGKGFVADEMKEGLGFKSMRSRVEYLGGQLTIDSKPGHGTHLHVQIS